MAHYEAEGIEAVGAGLILLRKRSAERHWVRIDDGPPYDDKAGAALLLGFRLRDFLESLPDDRPLLELPLRLSPTARVEHRLRPAPAGWTVADAKCLHDHGLIFIGQLDEVAFRLLTLCRGDRPLRDLLPGLARTAGRDPDELIPDLLPVVRGLVEQGFLLPPVIDDPAG